MITKNRKNIKPEYNSVTKKFKNNLERYNLIINYYKENDDGISVNRDYLEKVEKGIYEDIIGTLRSIKRPITREKILRSEPLFDLFLEFTSAQEELTKLLSLETKCS